MTFSRTALIVVGIAMVAGGAYGFWQYGHEAATQTANVAESLMPVPDAPALIVGTWTSLEDPKYQVTFTEGGIFTERYENAEGGSGTYVFAETPAGYVTGDVPAEAAGPYGYLLEELDGERYAYRVHELTTDVLRLTYLERGNTLTFSR